MLSTTTLVEAKKALAWTIRDLERTSPRSPWLPKYRTAREEIEAEIARREL